MLVKQIGIIINSIDYGESDRIITILNEHGSKIPLMVRRAKKVKSGFQATTQPFVKALFIYNKFRGMGTLTSVDVLDSNYNLRIDLLANSYASLCLEIIERSMDHDEISKQMYHLLTFAIDRINLGVSPQLIANIVMLKCLPRHGITLQLDKCVVTQSKQIEHFTAYSFTFNGILSKNAMYQDPHALPLSNKTIYITHALQHLKLDQINEMRIHQDIIEEMSTFILMIYKEYLGLYFKSQRLINQLKRSEANIFNNSN